MKRYHLFIKGRVQGVGFRTSTAVMARTIGVSGWVKNVGDQVEIMVEGEDKRVDKFINWCKKGPVPFARVENTDIIEKKYKYEFKEFLIEY